MGRDIDLDGGPIESDGPPATTSPVVESRGAAKRSLSPSSSASSSDWGHNVAVSASGDAASGPSTEDECPSEDQERLAVRASADVDTLLGEWIPETQLENLWDKGLSPEPLFSFQDASTKCRHWAWDEEPEKFLCNRVRGAKHRRGGGAHMDIGRGLCIERLSAARTHKRVCFKEHMAFQVSAVNLAK